MRIRNLIIYLFLFSYAGALAHSLIPHHHDDSAEKLQEHIHSDSKASHHNNSSESNQEPEESPHFLTHLSNVDVLNQNNTSNSFVKKEVKKAVITEPFVEVNAGSFELPIFHPPDQQIVTSIQFQFRPLRAPPVLFA